MEQQNPQMIDHWQPGTVLTVRPENNVRHHYLTKCTNVFSFCLLALGVLASALQIWNAINSTPFAIAGTGMIVGAFVSIIRCKLISFKKNMQ